MKTLIGVLAKARQVAVFTGAGVSTLCGIPDFRGPQGLYKQPDAERIFDIDWFRRDRVAKLLYSDLAAFAEAVLESELLRGKSHSGKNEGA